MAKPPPYDTSSPLAFMLDLMRDEKQSDELRLKAAIGAAPYIHLMQGIQPVDPEMYDPGDDDTEMDAEILAELAGSKH